MRVGAKWVTRIFHSIVLVGFITCLKFKMPFFPEATIKVKDKKRDIITKEIELESFGGKDAAKLKLLNTKGCPIGKTHTQNLPPLSNLSSSSHPPSCHWSN